MFQINDYAVCPGHGVGKILAIEERQIGDEQKSFYLVKIISNNMTIMVPTSSETGIRSLVSKTEVEEIYKLLKQHNIEIDLSTWNRRYREYTSKINTGSLTEIAEVLRALFLLKNRKPLSFGEKKMLGHCLGLLSEEIALSNGLKSPQVSSKIEACFPQ